MKNPNNELWPSTEFFVADEFNDQQFSLATGEKDLSTDELFTEEDFECLINGPPVNVASHQSGVDGSMDVIARMGDNASTMAFVALETTPVNMVQSNMGTVEVDTNVVTPELNFIRQMDSHTFSMAYSGMWTMELYMGIEVATNVAATAVDTIVQTDGSAPTIATMEIGETSGLNVASSYEGNIEVATNVAATEMDTTAGIDVDASTMAIVPYIGTGEVVTNVAAIEMDIAAGTDVDASTMAIVPYIGTGEVVTNVATTELGMTIGVNHVNDNVVQNSATNNRAKNVFNFDQGKRKTSRFSREERLLGWTIKINPRPKDPTRTDRFFVHFGSGIQFRSKNEVDDFIHFGYHPKRQVPNASGPRRSTKRNINWRLYQRGVLPDGTTPIYDINFLEPGSKQKSNNIMSIEGTISDPEIDNPCKRRKTMKLLDDKGRVEAFLYETHQALRIKDKEDNDEDKDKNKYKDIGKGKGKMYED